MVVLIGKRIGFMVITMVVVSILLFLSLEFSLRQCGDKGSGALFVRGIAPALARGPMDISSPFGSATAYGWASSPLVISAIPSASRCPFSEILWPRLWNTAILGFWTFFFLIPVSLGLGVLAGMREGSKLDRVISIGSIITTSIPEFASTVFPVGHFCVHPRVAAGNVHHVQRLRFQATDPAGAGLVYL